MKRNTSIIRYIDLFCGIGGFRIAIENLASSYKLNIKCVFSSDIDKEAQKAYRANFAELPLGDITTIREVDIPDHELLMAGFPCQPFSIIGNKKGFADTRGILFFDIARILEAKRPFAFLLENVKQFRGHQKGHTLRRIMQTLTNMGYYCDYRILNALDFGLPQKRERIFIVGFMDPLNFYWPKGGIPMRPLSEILEPNPPPKFYASEHIRKKRKEMCKTYASPSILHENIAGHISAYPFSCALRAGASYNYLLVDGIRRLTPREMLRLQGFPDTYKIVCSDSETRTQAGNSVAVPVVEAILERMFIAMRFVAESSEKYRRFGSRVNYGFKEFQNERTKIAER